MPSYLALGGEDANAGSLEALDGDGSAGAPARGVPVEARRSADGDTVGAGSHGARASLGGRLHGQTLVPTPALPREAVPEIPVRSARLADIPLAGPPPVALTIPDIDVRAEIEAVGVDPVSRQVELPSSSTNVAWYEHSPVPGEAGSAVLAAHVDFGGRPGVFYRLRKLEPGSIVTVGFADGSRQSFEVVARRVFRKNELPKRRIFAKDGKPFLTLVTCGGGFNEAERSYDSNVVVFALPVGEGTGGGA